MANLTNSAKLIEEMEKKVNSSSLATVATSGSYTDLINKPTIPTVNNSTIKIQKNSADVDSFTTNASSGKTINITMTKSDVGLGNVDNTSDASKPISNATQTALNAKADANSVYTKAEVDSAISSAVSSVYKYKGSVANYASLPTTGLTVGDVYNVEDTGDNYAWTGTAWDKLAGTVDLSSYLTKSEASSTYATKTEVNAKADASDVNTKTFYLSSTSDLTNAQAAYNWHIAGKNPIIKLGGIEYIYYSTPSGAIKPIPYYFVCNGGFTRGNSSSQIILKKISLNVESNNVVSITSYTPESIRVLETDNNYTIAYTPQYDGSPATKKYVDDAASGKVSDTAYASSWNGVTTVAPSKNAVYDKISAMDTTIGNKANTSDLPSAMTLSELNTGTSTTGRTVSAALLKTGITGAISARISTTDYSSSWDGSEKAPTQDAVYDKINTMDTTISGKQNALSTQTAYTSKGTATKVPTITTNTLGQVTGITETSITFPVTSVNGKTGEVSLYSSIQVTLTSSGWSSNTQTVTATGVTASNNVVISPAPSSFSDYTSAVIYCSAQASNSLTFTCTDTPTSNLTVNVLIMN